MRPYAFGGCDTLTSASVGITSTTATSAYLFYKCAGLTYVELNIPATNIVAYTFTDCTKLSEVKFTNATTTKVLANS
ncbi:MAG: leucine-rich repeat protein [Treponema sp.]|nr:leucine-rich repeat protein [Treponema sp.]